MRVGVELVSVGYAIDPFAVLATAAMVTGPQAGAQASCRRNLDYTPDLMPASICTNNFESRRTRRLFGHALVLAMVLIVQVLPCIVGPPAAATQAHCHDAGDDASAAAATLVPSTGQCQHCLLLAPAPAQFKFAVAERSPQFEAYHCMLLPAVAASWRALPSFPIDRSHPPPFPALQSTLSHRVLLI
jgi:hypothetical protein